MKKHNNNRLLHLDWYLVNKLESLGSYDTIFTSSLPIEDLKLCAIRLLTNHKTITDDMEFYTNPVLDQVYHTLMTKQEWREVLLRSMLHKQMISGIPLSYVRFNEHLKKLYPFEYDKKASHIHCRFDDEKYADADRLIWSFINGAMLRFYINNETFKSLIRDYMLVLTLTKVIFNYMMEKSTLCVNETINGFQKILVYLDEEDPIQMAIPNDTTLVRDSSGIMRLVDTLE